MKSRSRWLGAIAVIAGALLWQKAPAAPKLGIEITTVPPWDPGGPDRMAPIAGRVVGDCKKCKVVLYTHGDVWYIQPYENRPATEIQIDGTWTNRIHLGTEYAALVTSAEYHALTTTGSLPTGRDILASTIVPGKKTVAAQGQAKATLEFCGRSWEVKTSRLAGPGPNRFALENVVVKPDGMHLRIRRDTGNWSCAEAICSDRLGFGRYTFEVGDVSYIDVNMVLGLFSWDPLASAHHFNEVDIELGHWGNARAPNTQFILQPWDVQGNRIRFDVPKGSIEYSFEWSPGRVACRALQGASTIRESLFEKGVPSPGGAQARANFWLFQSRPPQREAEVVVKRFHFTAIREAVWSRHENAE